MRTNTAGVEIIKKFEGCRLDSYLCPAEKWTVGYGHTKTAKPRQTITQDKADFLLALDLADAEAAVSSIVTVPLNENQFSALVSFTFNLGAGALKKSTLLKKLNAGNYASVPEQLRRWIHIGSAPSLGLVRRRKAEIELWEKPVKLNQKERQP